MGRVLLLSLAACVFVESAAKPLRAREARNDGDMWQMDSIVEDMPLAERLHRPEAAWLSYRLLRTSDFEGKMLTDAIQIQKNEGKNTCLTIGGRFMGGLANTVAMVNTALLYASHFDVKFGMPKIHPPGHGLRHQFKNIFAGANETCSGDVYAFEARCPDIKKGKHLRTTPPLLKTAGGWCDIDMMTIGSGQWVQSPMCGCDVLFTVNSRHMGWTTRYDTTFHVFRAAYWQGRYADQRGKTVEFPMSVTFHVRLGDVKSLTKGGYGEVQYVDTSKYLGMIDALAENIDTRCLNVLILSDGIASEDVELSQVEEKWRSVGAQRIQLFDRSTSARRSLSMMARADVNVGGTSGFVRLATILSHAKVRFFLNEKRVSKFPLEFLHASTNGTTMVGLNDDVTGYGKELGKNRVLQRLAEQCRKTL